MRVAILALAFALAGCSLFTVPRQPPAEPETEKVDVLGRAVDNTVALTEEDGRIFCTGVAAEGTFITAYHCVEEAPDPFFIVYRGKAYPGMAVMALEDNDIAIVEAVGARTRDTIPLSDWEVTLGMKVVWLGHPLGTNLKVGTGIVSAVREEALPSRFVVDGQFIPGQSGGPVLDERGHLIGIISSTMILPSFGPPQFLPFGLAVRPEHIKELLEAL